MNRRLVVASAAALLLTGCGGSPQTSPAPQAAESPSVPQQSAARPASPSTAAGTVLVDQQGTSPARTLWSLRLETTTAKPIAEQIFHTGPITLTRNVPGGSYRVIVWSRPCTGTCPTTGESGLGQLQEVCGAQITTRPGTRTQSTAVLSADGTCTIKVTH